MNAIEQADLLIAEGNALEDKGEFRAALDCYRRAATMAPVYPRAHLNIGNALRRLNRDDDAIAAFRKALQYAPNYAHARFNLGALLSAIGRHEIAELELRAVLRQQPEMLQAVLVLADSLQASGRLADAEREFHRAMDLSPDHAGANFNFGLLRMRQNRFAEALDYMVRAKALDPDVKDVESVMLFSLSFRDDLDADSIAREHRRVGTAICREAGPPFATWSNQPDPERRLRLGYVSGDFRLHPVALFLRPVLERHDKQRFEVFCYSNSKGADTIKRALQDRAEHWCEISGLDDRSFSERIRADEIDILVDLSGHTNSNRLFVFARHPAPVQVTWLGYLNTTGLPRMDYRICDWHTDPSGETEVLHSERLHRMPHSQWCYVPWGYMPQVAAPHADRPEEIIFGSFNQFLKISDACLALWARILDRVPEATLTVLDVEGPNRRSLLDRLARHGIESTRVSLHGRQNLHDFYAAIGNVDVALDTYPHNGATTTFDTLWMGVPLVALRGERGISRSGYSILRSLDMPELIAGTADEYVELNVRLASDASWRSRLRATLRDRLAASSLMDGERFTRDLEAGYRQMWRTWCASHRSGVLPIDS